MSDLQKRIIGSTLTAVFSALLAYVKPELWPAATSLFGLVMGWLHIPRPGDVPALPKADPSKSASL